MRLRRPQTVWTEVFIGMEQLFEGDRSARLRWTVVWTREKIQARRIRGLIVFALWTGFTFVGFFTPIKELALRTAVRRTGWEIFWVLFYSIAKGNAGVLREQVCKYMCPTHASERDVRPQHAHHQLRRRARRARGRASANAGFGRGARALAAERASRLGAAARPGTSRLARGRRA